MDEVDALARGRARQVALLAHHPLDAVAGLDGDRDRGDQLAPGAVGGLGGLAVDECGELQVGPLGDELRDQLAGVGLHAADLAGDEEDEVQADVHQTSTRS